MVNEMGCLENEKSGSQTLQRIGERLQLYKPKLEEPKDASDDGIQSMGETEEISCVHGREKKAAVLIGLFEGNQGELRVILTKRSMKLSSHPGDVALPGGKMEEGDADESETALREAMEEIGLEAGLVQVVTRLEPFISQHLMRVIPVVGLLSRVQDFRPVLNFDEVDALFDVPLDLFLKEKCHRCEEREWMGWKYNIHLFDFESDQGIFLICGLTASILIRTASIVYEQFPCFNHSLPDFQQLQQSLNNVNPSH